MGRERCEVRSQIGRGRLPIFTLRKWRGARVLVDTGSTSTIIGKTIADKMGWLKRAKGCKCRMNTVVGSQDMLGEFKLNLKELTGEIGEKIAHIAEIPEHTYDVILGTDILRPFKGYPRYKRGQWRIKIGKASFRAGGCIEQGEQLGVTLVTNEKEREASLNGKIIQSFREVTYRDGEPLTATGKVEHHISLIGERPVYVKPRRYPQAYETVIREQIGEMLQAGVIRPSVSPFCSPLWVVPKPPDARGDPRYRVVVDYRDLNKRTETEKYPLPRLEEMLDRMAYSTVFSVLDLKAGYHQIQMNAGDIEKTAFQFGRGKFEFVRMPFGLKNAPSTFQRMIDEFLVGLDEGHVQAYMDDIVIFSKNHEEHRRHLGQVLDRLREFKLKISQEKSSFFRPEVKFMGHIVSEKGVRPNIDKVAAIREIPLPKNVKDVRSFLGVVNYYRRFLGNLAEKVEPLNRLLKKNTKFNVTEEVRESIEWCKEKLSTAPILQFPDFNIGFILTTDASQLAVGAVLSQIGENGEQPVAFASRRLSGAESRYSTIERELLGVVWAVEYFRAYLLGRKFLIKTDHKPLVWVEKLRETSARICRWKEILAAYNFDIIHTKGVDNVVADCLSRQINAIEEVSGEPESFGVRYLRTLAETGPERTLDQRPPGIEEITVEGGEEEAIERDLERYTVPAEGDPREIVIEETMINNKRRQLIMTQLEGEGIGTQSKIYKHISTVWVAVGRSADENDILSTLGQVIEPGRLYHIFVANPELRTKVTEWYRRGRLARGATLVLCTKKVDTVENERQQIEIVEKYHSGQTNHRGVSETLTHLRRAYYWVGMPITIKEVIGACQTCKIGKYERAPATTPQLVTETPKVPLALVQIDILFWSGIKILTILDVATRFLFASCISRKTGIAVRNTLLTYFGTIGTPQKLVLDPGREFKNREIQGLLDEFNVQVHFTTPGHPRSHGAIERVHSTITEHLHLLKTGRELTGQEAVARAVLAYNNTLHSVTKRTPIELMRAWKREETDTPLAQEMDQIGTREEGQKEKRIQKHNHKREWLKPREVKLGEQVFIKNLVKRLKTDPPFVGPFLVLGILDKYKIQLRRVTGTNTRIIIRHLDEIRIRRQGK